MKKVISFILSVTLVFACIGCSSKKEEEARIAEEARIEAEKKEAGKQLAGEIYTELKKVYEAVDTIGGDIYQVWTISSTNKKDVVADPIKQLANNTHLDESEIALGTIVALDVAMNAKAPGDKETIIEKFRGKSDEERKQLTDVTGSEDMQTFFPTVFSSVSPLSDFCVYAIQDAYDMKGSFSEIQECLNGLKDKIKQLNADYPDFEAFEDLKNIYTQTSGYYEFCMDPKGNLIQAMNTINDYRNSVKASMTELDFIF